LYWLVNLLTFKALNDGSDLILKLVTFFPYFFDNLAALFLLFFEEFVKVSRFIQFFYKINKGKSDAVLSTKNSYNRKKLLRVKFATREFFLFKKQPYKKVRYLNQK
jgi:hypothetical protein